MQTTLLAILLAFGAFFYVRTIWRFVKQLDPLREDEPEELPDGQPDFTLDDLDWSEEYD